MSNILEVKDLKVAYGGIEAVRGISFDVPEGQIVTLIGANGAGKSSTLRSIVGLEKPKAGSIKFQDMDLVGMGTETIVTKGITLVPEGRTCFCQPVCTGEFEDGCLYAKGQYRGRSELGLRSVPEIKGKKLAGSRYFIRWRAADAGHCPCTDV